MNLKNNSWSRMPKPFGTSLPAYPLDGSF